jgi:uncharacterized protein DUF547
MFALECLILAFALIASRAGAPAPAPAPAAGAAPRVIEAPKPVLAAEAREEAGPVLPLEVPDEADPYADLNTILSRHVKKEGVDYAGLGQRSRKELDRFLLKVEKQDPKKLKTKKERIAFYVNAYNAHVLRKVLELTPKQTSVLDKEGFFDRDQVAVAGRKLTLNALEKLARDEGDPRVHFVVNCASGSCPPLLDEALTAKNLEAKLTSATGAYLRDTKHGLSFTAQGEVALSKIFEWYAKDFAKSGKATEVLDWIRKQAGSSALGRRLKGKSKVVWKSYDWSLNAVRR